MYKKLMTAALLVAFCTVSARATAPFQINGDVGLSALIGLSDGRMQSLAAILEAIAEGPSVQSGQWSRIQRPLREAAALGIPGVLLFATPDGTYWTVSGGKMSANIADRGYFKTAMSGRVSIGDVVTGRSTGKAQAMVAVPIK